MTTTTLLMYMTMGEIGLLAVVVSIYLVVRARKSKQTVVTRAAPHRTAPPVRQAPGLASHIQKLIQQTRKRLNSGEEKNTQILEARIQFLEAEAALLSDDPLQDSYWADVSQHLSSLFPDKPDSEQVLAELDDIDTDDASSEKPKGSVTIDTTPDEINRLRQVIRNQHGAIDELKQTLMKQSLSASQSEALSKQLEQIEVAHAQLNMCVEVLEKENLRLTSLLQSKKTDNGEDTTDLQDARQQLDQANERIGNLEHENAEKSRRIEALEKEIETLEKQLQEHEEQLRRTQQLDSGDSALAAGIPSNPNELREQIESISELLMQKSGELQLLHPGHPANAEIQRKVQSALHQASSAAARKPSSPDIAEAGDDEIPVLEPFSEGPDAATPLPDKPGISPDSDNQPPGIAPTLEGVDKSDITPQVASADLMDQFDDHDIVVEDDLLDMGMDDEITSFLSRANPSDDDDDDTIDASKTQNDRNAG